MRVVRRWVGLSMRVCLLLSMVIWSLPTHAEVVREPYLQAVTDSSIFIVWRTKGAIEPVVQYGSKVRSLKSMSESANITVRVSSDLTGDRKLYSETEEEAQKRESRRRDDPSGDSNIYQYEVELTGLDANSEYFYAVYDGDNRLTEQDKAYRFKTLPKIGDAIPQRIWVVGDSGTGGGAQRKVYDAMLEFVDDTKRDLDMFIHVGDMAYTDGANYEFQRGFFDPYADTLKQVVVWPSMGNHEGYTSRGLTGIGPYYDAYIVPTQGEAGGVASGTEAYYSYDVGAIHFICLDSHDLDRTSSGPMAQWLREDLAQTSSEWLIAFWHHPPYTKGSHDSDKEGQLIEMREQIMPILEGHGVDLVLTGHSHVYERSMLMDGAYATPTVAEGVILDDGDGNPEGDGPYMKSAGLNPHEGTIQIVAGHGGAGVSRKGTMPVMREIIVENGSVILDIDGDTLLGHMINRDGEIRDVFSLVKRGTVEVKRVENPWRPADKGDND